MGAGGNQGATPKCSDHGKWEGAEAGKRDGGLGDAPAAPCRVMDLGCHGAGPWSREPHRREPWSRTMEQGLLWRRDPHGAGTWGRGPRGAGHAYEAVTCMEEKHHEPGIPTEQGPSWIRTMDQNHRERTPTEQEYGAGTPAEDDHRAGYPREQGPEQEYGAGPWSRDHHRAGPWSRNPVEYGAH